jgi:hypothetical protein
MFNKFSYAVATSAIIFAGCASPPIVTVKQVGDTSMSCEQLKKAYDEATEFEENARKERKVTGTNIAAAVFFWPALIATYSNTEDAIGAAKDRQKMLTKISDEKNCKF